MQLIDTHAHLTSPSLLPDVEALVERAKAAQLKHIVNICTDSVSLKEGLLLEERHPWICNAGATTPHDVEKEGEEYFSDFEKAAHAKKLIAVGETGLDYHYEHSSRAIQKKFLVRYLHLAHDCNLPVIFHCRDAFDDLFTIADREAKGIRAVLHCFTGTLEEAKKGVDRGWMISFSGIITFKKSVELRETAKALPLEHLLIETDSPYLAPQSKRGQTNEPSFIVEIAECLAALKGISMEQLARISFENANRTFFWSR